MKRRLKYCLLFGSSFISMNLVYFGLLCFCAAANLQGVWVYVLIGGCYSLLLWLGENSVARKWQIRLRSYYITTLALPFALYGLLAVGMALFTRDFNFFSDQGDLFWLLELTLIFLVCSTLLSALWYALRKVYTKK